MFTVASPGGNPNIAVAGNEVSGQGQSSRGVNNRNYKGFVAGVFSGIAKLSGQCGFLSKAMRF